MSYAGSDRSLEVETANGIVLQLRPATKEDRSLFKQGIDELSGRSRFLRFFSRFREAPDSVLDQLSAIDGKDHIAWCAIELKNKSPHPIGVAHAIRSSERPEVAELAAAVTDEFQRQGIAAMLLALVMKDCIDAGYTACSAHVLSQNTASVHLTKSLGAMAEARDGAQELFRVAPQLAIERLQLRGLPPSVMMALENQRGFPRGS